MTDIYIHFICAHYGLLIWKRTRTISDLRLHWPPAPAPAPAAALGLAQPQPALAKGKLTTLLQAQPTELAQDLRSEIAIEESYGCVSK